jgi:hypothetical protein
VRLWWFYRVLYREGLKMGATILYCQRCHSGYGSIGEVPLRCPACDQVTSWSTTAPVIVAPEPQTPWKIGINDARFLKSIKILPDEEAS